MCDAKILLCVIFNSIVNQMRSINLHISCKHVLLTNRGFVLHITQQYIFDYEHEKTNFYGYTTILCQIDIFLIIILNIELI